MAKKKFYVTTAIDYVNDKPHIGHSYQKVLADILSRWHKQLGEDVFFLTGTDEHGQKLADSAAEAGLPPKKFVDKISAYFKEAWDKLNIKYDRFIRTTDKDHEAAVKEFIKLLYKKGDIYEGTYEGLYCRRCERYYTEKDLQNGLCPDHRIAPELISEPCYFFRLSKYQDALLDLYEQRPNFVLPKTRLNEVKQRVESGLKDLAISRTTLSWGIPFPIGRGHVTYVWFEALQNYITGIGWPKNMKVFNKYWPADVHLLGKDNNWFHAVIWPALLLAAGIELPVLVYAHGWLNLKGRKMSKSLGNVIDPISIVNKYGADAYRYYFSREFTPREDNYYSEEGLVERYNTELANEFGNLISRVVSMISKYNQNVIPKGAVKLSGQKALAKANKQIETVDVNRAVEIVWTFIREVNKYIQNNKPWELNGKRRDEVLFNAVCGVRDAIALAWPFVPEGAEKAAKQLGLKKVPKFKDIGKALSGRVIRAGPIYPHLEYQPDEKVFNLDIRAGKVLSVDAVPNSEKLYKLQVSFGKEKKQVIAGLKPYFSAKELKGREFVFLFNLATAKLAGEKSEAMILAAEDEGRISLLKPAGKISLEGYASKPAKIVSLKDFSNWKLKVRDGKVLCGDAVLTGVKSEFKKGKVV